MLLKHNSTVQKEYHEHVHIAPEWIHNAKYSMPILSELLKKLQPVDSGPKRLAAEWIPIPHTKRISSKFTVWVTPLVVSRTLTSLSRSNTSTCPCATILSSRIQFLSISMGCQNTIIIKSTFLFSLDHFESGPCQEILFSILPTRDNVLTSDVIPLVRYPMFLVTCPVVSLYWRSKDTAKQVSESGWTYHLTIKNLGTDPFCCCASVSWLPYLLFVRGEFIIFWKRLPAIFVSSFNWVFSCPWLLSVELREIFKPLPATT